jgi:uncharacterized integral membrane protein
MTDHDDPTAEEPQGPVGSGAAPERAAGAPLTQQVGRVAVTVLAVLFGIFAVFNSQSVSFDWIVGETVAVYSDTGEHLGGGVPLIVLLLASFVLGFAAGGLATWRRGRRRARRA